MEDSWVYSCVMFLGGRGKDYNDHIIGGEFNTNPLIEILNSISTVHVHGGEKVVSRIASDPFGCASVKMKYQLNCTLDLSVETCSYRKRISFSAVTVGQGNFTVPSSVGVSLKFNVQLDQIQNIQGTMNTCTNICLLYTSPSPRDATLSRMPSSA